MQFSTLTILSIFASGVYSQGIPNIPQCSLQCFTTALTSDGCSSLTDFACHCQKQTLASQITSCVQGACSPSDQQAVLQTVQDTCKQAGHPITVAIPSTTEGGSSTAASSAAESSSAPASTSASASSEATSAASSASETATSLSSAASTAAASTPATTEASASPSAASPSASQFTGAAAINNIQPVRGLGAMLLAVVAYFL